MIYIINYVLHIRIITLYLLGGNIDRNQMEYKSKQTVYLRKLFLSFIAERSGVWANSRSEKTCLPVPINTTRTSAEKCSLFFLFRFKVKVQIYTKYLFFCNYWMFITVFLIDRWLLRCIYNIWKLLISSIFEQNYFVFLRLFYKLSISIYIFVYSNEKSQNQQRIKVLFPRISI